jgi:hypothetical protein
MAARAKRPRPSDPQTAAGGRAVQRWEKQESLPVHRHPHQKGSSVYAYTAEMDQWRESRKPAPPPPSLDRRLLMPSFALTLALCLMMAGNGVRPRLVEAGALGERRILVCSSSDWEQTKLARDVEGLLLKDGGFSTPSKLRTAFPGGDARAEAAERRGHRFRTIH